MMSGRNSDEERDLSAEVEPKSSTTGGSPDELRILEAVLFASDELMNAAHLKTILPSQPDARRIRSMVEKLNVQLQKERHPFEIAEIGGGYQFRTITYYHPWVRQIFKEKAAKKLSIQALECLAIIAYKQPISKAEIEAIRGVVSDGAMKTLLEKRLVTITGRSEKPGRPLLYGTTQTFLRYFGLNRREDLPRIEEFEVMAREKMEELSIDDLEQEEIDQKVEAVGDGDAVESPESGTEESSLFEVSLTEEKTDSAPADDAAMGVEDTQPIQPPESETVKPAAGTDAENTEVEAEATSPVAAPTTEAVADQEEPDENEETIEITVKESSGTPEVAPELTASADPVDSAVEEEGFEFETVLDNATAEGASGQKDDPAMSVEAPSEQVAPSEPSPADETILVAEDREEDKAEHNVSTEEACGEHGGQENIYELETTVACLADIEKKETAPIEQSREDMEELFEIGEVAADAPVAESTVKPTPEETAAFEVQLPESETSQESGDSGAPEEKLETPSAGPKGKKAADPGTVKKSGRKTTAGSGKTSGAKGSSSSRKTTRKKKDNEPDSADQKPAAGD
jgi:segregation and condensation protein B